MKQATERLAEFIVGLVRLGRGVSEMIMQVPAQYGCFSIHAEVPAWNATTVRLPSASMAAVLAVISCYGKGLSASSQVSDQYREPLSS